MEPQQQQHQHDKFNYLTLTQQWWLVMLYFGGVTRPKNGSIIRLLRKMVPMGFVRHVRDDEFALTDKGIAFVDLIKP